MGERQATVATIDPARLGDPEIARRREAVVGMLVHLFREVATFAERPVGIAWDDIGRLVPDTAIDIARTNGRVDSLAIKVIEGAAELGELQVAIANCLLFWRRALAALELRRMTCSRCGAMKPSVAARAGHDEPLCLQCWKAFAICNE
jgi:hypothetical protein